MTIVSSDKDFLQLVTEDVSVFDPFNMARIGPNEVFEKYGVSECVRLWEVGWGLVATTST